MSTVADISTHVMPQQGASNSGAMDGYVREDVEDLLSAQASALQTMEQPVETLLRQGQQSAYLRRDKAGQLHVHAYDGAESSSASAPARQPGGATVQRPGKRTRLAAHGSSSGPKRKRPPGAAPKGKVWDATLGGWILALAHFEGPRQRTLLEQWGQPSASQLAAGARGTQPLLPPL
jgi:hypothetical protein